jgi:predicted nucleic acid-binding Zn ribbon protein
VETRPRRAYAAHVRRRDSDRESEGPRRVGGVLQGVISRLGLRRELDDYRVFEAWERIVGPQIARNAQPTRLDAKRLVVTVKSAVWMQELALLREDIRRKLNEWMGREIVSEVFLVLGAPPEGDGGGGVKRSRPPARRR